MRNYEGHMERRRSQSWKFPLQLVTEVDHNINFHIEKTLQSLAQPVTTKSPGADKINP